MLHDYFAEVHIKPTVTGLYSLDSDEICMRHEGRIHLASYQVSWFERCFSSLSK